MGVSRTPALVPTSITINCHLRASARLFDSASARARLCLSSFDFLLIVAFLSLMCAFAPLLAITVLSCVAGDFRELRAATWQVCAPPGKHSDYQPVLPSRH